MGNRCEWCGNVTATRCLCEGCRCALLSQPRTVTPTIVAQIRGDVPAVVGQTTAEALRSLCATAECSRPRQAGSMYCADCAPVEVPRHTPQPIGEDNGVPVWPAEDVTIYPYRPPYYPGRRSVMPGEEDDLRAFRGLFWAVVWFVLIPVLIYTVGWGHGIR